MNSNNNKIIKNDYKLVKSCINLKGNLLIEYKKSLYLNDHQRDILVGSLLGKASISLRKSTIGYKPDYRIKFQYPYSHKIYAIHVYKILSSFISQDLSFFELKNKKKSKYISFNTFIHHDFVFFFNMFYFYKDVDNTKNNLIKYKKIPEKTYLVQLLTSRALAYWFMDSGFFDAGSNSFGFIIRYRLSQQEIDDLIDVFKFKFNLKVKIRPLLFHMPRFFIIRFNNLSNCNRFRSIISSFLDYKIIDILLKNISHVKKFTVKNEKS